MYYLSWPRRLEFFLNYRFQHVFYRFHLHIIGGEIVDSNPMCIPLIIIWKQCPGPSLWYAVLVFTQTQTRDHEFGILSCTTSKTLILLWWGKLYIYIQGTSLCTNHPEILMACSMVFSGLAILIFKSILVNFFDLQIKCNLVGMNWVIL